MPRINEEIDKVNAFLEQYGMMSNKPYPLPYTYYVADTYQGKVDRFCITDDECTIIVHDLTSFETFLLWFVKQIIINSYKSGQEDIRFTMKELLGITAR